MICEKCEEFEATVKNIRKTIDDAESDAIKKRLASLQEAIIRSRSVNLNQLAVLKGYPKEERLNFFSELLSAFRREKELTEDEIRVLETIRTECGLTREDIEKDDTLLAYYYISKIKYSHPQPFTLVGDEKHDIRSFLKKEECPPLETPKRLRDLLPSKKDHGEKPLGPVAERQEDF